jgi:hypothetical protein
MAYTEAQWNRIQRDLPPEDQVSYLEYLRQADPAAYRRLTGAAAMVSLKADSLEPRSTTTVSAVEQAAKMRALEAEAKKNAAEKATQQAIEDAYYTVRVGNTGMTQAQLDAQANAIATAKLIGGTTIPNPAGGLTVVAPKATTPSADKAAADKVAADALAAQKAAEAALAAAKTAAELEAAKTAARLADEQKAAAEKALADLTAKTAADAKAAADKAAADLKAAIAAGNAAAIEAARIAAANAQGASDAAALAAAQSAATANAAVSSTLTNVSGNVALPIAGTTAADIAAKAQAEQAKLAMRESTIKILVDRFNKYNLGSLANKIRDLAIDGATEATITLDLQETDEYQMRFKANQERIKKGLQVLNPAEYLNLEDGYRQVLRAYGLKEFDTDDYVSQFIANDVSAAELSNRVVTAVQRVQNADPALIKQLDEFYGIKSNRLVAYVLDPNQQFQKIERQIAAGEIGVAAQRQGLQAGVQVAEQLAAQGITEAEARRGYATIADILPTAEKLSDIYGTTLDPYGQSEGEQEVFNQLASAQRKRQRLTAREVAAFSGAAGVNRTSLTTPTAGQY